MLRALANYFPQTVEAFYSRFLFGIIRTGLDYSVALIPLPLWLVAASLLVIWLLVKIKQAYHHPSSTAQKLINIVFSTLAFISGIIILFMIAWGFNYARIPIKQQFDLPMAKISKQELQMELEQETARLIALRNRLDLVDKKSRATLKEKTKSSLITTFKENHFPVLGNPRMKLNQPKGFLLRWSTAGFYFPWLGDCNVDPGLLDIQLPFVMAHEYAHAYGVTNEGECNFLAYLACMESEDSFVQYSGSFSYWQILRRNYRRSFGQETHDQMIQALPQNIKDDIKAVYENGLKYPDILPKLRFATYDLFLKSQGVKEGNASYSEIVNMVIAWRKKGNN